MNEWRPIGTCPENTWVLLYRSWDEFPHITTCRYKWAEFVEWETVSESSGKSGTRRQVRQEKITREQEWYDGGSGGDYWMPLPEPPKEQP